MRHLPAAALALLLAACAAPAPSPTPPAAIGACTINELVVEFRGWNGATGSLVGSIAFANRSSLPCTLEGTPRVRLLNASGRALPVDVRTLDVGRSTRTVVLAPGNARLPAPGVALRPGQASLLLVWSNWCGEPPDLARIAIAPGGGSEFTVAATLHRIDGRLIAPRCDEPTVSSRLGVGSFEPAAP